MSSAPPRSAEILVAPLGTRRIPGETGIWVLVLGEMSVFGLFFATFMYSRGRNLHAFAAAHSDLSVLLGTINTILLLTSSLIVALAVKDVMSGDSRRAPQLFWGALACGACFIAVKALEWTHLFVDGRSVTSGYFQYYFMLTGIHLGHVVIGMVVLSRLIFVTRRAPELSPAQRRLCEVGGIFWHMVDLLWVVLFALFYLVR